MEHAAHVQQLEMAFVPTGDGCLTQPRADQWTPGEIEQLRQMHADGVMRRVMADRIGRSKNAVVGMIFRLKLPPRPKPEKPEKEAPARKEVVITGPVHPWRTQLNRVVKFTPAKEFTDPIVQPPTGKSLAELRADDCRWIVGPADGEHHYCGKPGRDRKQPWCKVHFWIVYKRPTR